MSPTVHYTVYTVHMLPYKEMFMYVDCSVRVKTNLHLSGMLESLKTQSY